VPSGGEYRKLIVSFWPTKNYSYTCTQDPKIGFPSYPHFFVKGGGWRAGMMAKAHTISCILAILVFFTANFLCGNANCDLKYCWTYTTCCHGLTNTFPKSHLQEMLKTITKGTHIFATNYLMNFFFIVTPCMLSSYSIITTTTGHI
jgi:hypothetical protein